MKTTDNKADQQPVHESPRAYYQSLIDQGYDVHEAVALTNAKFHK